MSTTQYALVGSLFRTIRRLRLLVYLVIFLADQVIISPVCSVSHGMLRPQFVLFGDSLTQKACDPDGGWAAGLANKYQRKAGAVMPGLIVDLFRTA